MSVLSAKVSSEKVRALEPEPPEFSKYAVDERVKGQRQEKRLTRIFKLIAVRGLHLLYR